MSPSLKKPPAQTDLSVIDSASTVVVSGEYKLTTDDLFNQIGDLSNSLADAEAEIERLEGMQSVEQVKARMLEPYVKKVFQFVLWYCIAVAGILIISGFEISGFSLPETILAIISGSTAVSVIGLIGLVITGLFGKSSD